MVLRGGRGAILGKDSALINVLSLKALRQCDYCPGKLVAPHSELIISSIYTYENVPSALERFTVE